MQIKLNDPRRWMVLASFCSFSFTNAMAFVQYSPIVQLASPYYGVSDQAIIWLSGIYYITYFLFAPISLKPLQYSLSSTLGLFSFITAIGAWLKYAAFGNYEMTFWAFVIIGIGQLCVLAAPIYISEMWFPIEEKTVAISIGTYCNFLGMNFAVLFVALLFDNIKDTGQGMDIMNLTFALMSTLAHALCLVFIKDDPIQQTNNIKQLKDINIISSYIKLFKQFYILCDLISLSTFIGASWVYGVIISLILTPFHYSQNQIGWVCLCFSTTGTIGGLLASIYVDRLIVLKQLPNYDLLIKIFICIGYISIFIHILLIDLVSDLWIIIFSGLIGFGLNSFQPIAIQSLVEKTYPIFELVLISALMQSGNLIALIMSYFLLLPGFEDKCLLVILAFCSPPFLYIVLTYQTQYKKSQKSDTIEYVELIDAKQLNQNLISK